jgi:pSer/pThr/pTyr-binding forkhead associated (FHA) protein
MSKLILSFEGTVLATVVVNKDRITIGRKPENDIQVDNLAVSGHHAAVVRVGNDLVLEDLNSTNGTIVNGQLAQKHVLQNFDVIELGKHKLKYVVDAQINQAGMEKTMVMRRPVLPSATDMRSAGSANPGAAAAATPATNSGSTLPGAGSAPATPCTPVIPATPLRTAALQVLTGSATGRVLDLTKNLTKLGSSGQVAVITRRPTGYFLTHVEGAHFPVVNGQSIGAQAHELQDKDTIDLVGTKMSFFFKD